MYLVSLTFHSLKEWLSSHLICLDHMQVQVENCAEYTKLEDTFKSRTNWTVYGPFWKDPLILTENSYIG